MILILFVICSVALGLAGWNWYAVLDELRRAFPKQFSERELSVAVSYHIWTPLMSDAARRRYVWFHLWGSLAFLCLSAILWLSDQLIGAAVMGGITILTTASIAWQSYRYRVRGRKFSN
jgi:hypothetical protein